MSKLGNANALADSCCRREWVELCRCLAQGHPVNQKDEHGVFPLQICAAAGWSQAVVLLLKHGADVNLACSLGWTALMQSVRNGHMEVAEILLDAGANTSDRNSLGWNAVCLAVESRNKRLLKLLVSMAKACELAPALAVACQLGNVDFVKYLLNQQADINGKLPVSGLTPLMMATCGGHAGVVELLLVHGANPNIVNSCNLTAVDMALMNGLGGIGAMLSMHFKSSPRTAPTYCLSPCVPLSKASLCDNLPVSCHGKGLHPCSPICQTPSMRANSTEVFKFPPSPTCVYAPTNCIARSPHHSPTSPYGYYMPHNSYQCISPSPCSSPMIPPWMFAYGQWNHKTQPKFRVKTKKSLQNWWKNLKKRCKRKKLQKRIEVFVTFDEPSATHPDDQFEALLCGLNLDSLIPLLKNHEIDRDTFLHLRRPDLEELGIVDKALQFSILQKISDVNSSMVI